MKKLLPKPGFVLACLFTLGACGGADGHRRAAPLPAEPSIGREEIMVEAANELGDEPFWVARYNPPSCPCPPFELRVGSAWVRIVLVQSEEDEAKIKELIRHAKRELSRGEPGLYYFEGSLDPDGIQRTATGFPVMEFDFFDYHLEAPEQKSEEESE